MHHQNIKKSQIKHKNHKSSKILLISHSDQNFIFEFTKDLLIFHRLAGNQNSWPG